MGFDSKACSGWSLLFCGFFVYHQSFISGTNPNVKLEITNIFQLMTFNVYLNTKNPDTSAL